ncbi:MAG TPA: hypothetical protein VN327_05355 [Pseudonocardiaceae bacterium]|nr:hypothetical protein [Pseudonocardiaceae bacterium]
MDTLAPAVADAFGLLQMNLYRHLDEAEFLARKCRDWTEEDVETARELIPDLVIVIRGLLFDHQVRRGGGNCRTCASAWPCPVVTLVHGLIKDPDRQFIALVSRVDEER